MNHFSSVYSMTKNLFVSPRYAGIPRITPHACRMHSIHSDAGDNEDCLHSNRPYLLTSSDNQVRAQSYCFVRACDVQLVHF